MLAQLNNLVATAWYFGIAAYLNIDLESSMLNVESEILT